jgi:hypothetical protein
VNLSAIVEAISRLEGPANGIMLRRKEVSKIPEISTIDPISDPSKPTSSIATL